MKSSYTSFEMLLNESQSVSIHNENEEINIQGSKIKVFAQNDVIKGFFKGIDDELLSQISSEIENYSNESLDTLINKLKKENEISKNYLEKIQNEINLIKENSIIKLEFEDSISNLQKENMENMLEEIEIMPPEEIIKMSKTLINLTRLKRIIRLEQVTVDGRILTFVLTLKKGIEKFY